MKLCLYDVEQSITSGIPSLQKVREYKVPAAMVYIRNSQDVREVVTKYYKFATLAEEEACVICANASGRILGMSVVTHGSVNLTILPIREIFQRALLMGAAWIVVVHNHPSGDSRPSSCDLETTKKLVEAGQLLGVPVQDHIIIGSDVFSFRDNGLIPSKENLSIG